MVTLDTILRVNNSNLCSVLLHRFLGIAGLRYFGWWSGLVVATPWSWSTINEVNLMSGPVSTRVSDRVRV